VKRLKMKKVTAGLLALLIGCLAQAQQVFFIYIQAENRQPFYVRMNGKTYNSTPAGYMVLPKLTSGQYNLKMGWPRSSDGEQDFTCTVANDDQGYALKNFADKGWGLFNLRSYEVMMAGTKPAAPAATAGGNENYANVLADVVKDNSIKDVNVPKPEPVKPQAPAGSNETASPVPEKKEAQENGAAPASTTSTPPAVPEKKEVKEATQIPASTTKTEAETSQPVKEAGESKPVTTSTGNMPQSVPVETKPEPVKTDIKETTPSVTQTKPDSVKEMPAITATSVSRIFTFNGSQGIDQIYVLQTGSMSDTVRIFIPHSKNVPADTPSTTEPPKQAADTPKPLTDNPPIITDTLKAAPTSPPPAAATETKPAATDNDKKFLNIPVSPVVTPDTGMAPKPVALTAPAVDSGAASKLVMFNTTCGKVASEDDYIKLRKKMAGERTDEDMLDVARKAFKQKCYLAQHIRGLAALLSSDEGKYNLLDAAYKYTYDTEQFKTLADLLKDAYYVSRFNAMIRK
jgi:hypothetical protein